MVSKVESATWKVVSFRCEWSSIASCVCRSADGLHMQDIESGLYYSLWSEIPSSRETFDHHALSALKLYIDVLSKVPCDDVLLLWTVWGKLFSVQFQISWQHTHPFNGPFSGLPRWASTRKVKLIWILLKQETVSGSGISSAICKSATRSWQIITPAPHHSVFLQARCPSCHPTNSVKALKAKCQADVLTSKMIFMYCQRTLW